MFNRAPATLASFHTIEYHLSTTGFAWHLASPPRASASLSG